MDKSLLKRRFVFTNASHFVSYEELNERIVVLEQKMPNLAIPLSLKGLSSNGLSGWCFNFNMIGYNPRLKPLPCCSAFFTL